MGNTSIENGITGFIKTTWNEIVVPTSIWLGTHYLGDVFHNNTMHCGTDYGWQNGHAYLFCRRFTITYY